MLFPAPPTLIVKGLILCADVLSEAKIKRMERNLNIKS
jgi:hypothetical protein